MALKGRRDAAGSGGGDIDTNPAPAAASKGDAVSRMQLDKMNKALALLTTNINVERGRVADLEQRLERSEREMERLRAGGGGLPQCLKCGLGPRERAFVPCGHALYCAACAKPMAQCGKCNTHVLGKVPVRLE